MRRSIFTRYFLRSVILLTVSMMALSAAFVVGASRILSAQQKNRMVLAAGTVNTYITPRFTLAGGFISLEELKSVLPIITSIGDIQVMICDADGTVKLRSDESSAASLPQPVMDFLQNLDQYSICEIPSGLIRAFVNNADMVIARPLIIPVPLPGGTAETLAGYIIISSYQNSTHVLMWELARTWTAMGVVIIPLSGATAYFSAKRQSKPLRQMAALAHSFALGDFSVRVDADAFPDAEVHDLAQAFNGMATALERGEELRRGFIANVSHELKTPMTIISGYIGGILDGTVPEDRRADTLSLVSDEVMRLSRLVERAATLARLQSEELELKPRPVDVAELALRLLLGFEQRISERELSVALDLPEPETLYAMADPDALTQVFTNLLDNAVKFSHPGGELRLAIITQGGKIRVTVANQGQPIPEEDLPFVFDRFYKADRSRSQDRSGLGLGLFLVRGILHAHKEEITAASADGRTAFTFTLTVFLP